MLLSGDGKVEKDKYVNLGKLESLGWVLRVVEILTEHFQWLLSMIRASHTCLRNLWIKLLWIAEITLHMKEPGQKKYQKIVQE